MEVTEHQYHIPGVPNNVIGPYSSLAAQKYGDIKADCLRNNTLFCDPDFPADDRSIGKPEQYGRYTWRRPKEMIRNAKFMSEGVSRFDVKQGELGNCWFASSVVALCDQPGLLHQVVPMDQSMTTDYAGVFRFHFWRYGTWTEVIVDDRLPTLYGKPAFMSSTDSTEFWSSLLEKAYAKLHGSYGALAGGHAADAMEDFTGGLREFYEFRNMTTTKQELFDIMEKALERHSMLSTAMEGRSMNELANGLVTGHAYTVNMVKELNLVNGRSVNIIRMRNPWGNDKEWKLGWSDGSREWDSVSEHDKAQIEYTKCADGEFWMSYEDFLCNFSKLEICNLGPDALTEELADKSNKRWEMVQHEGEWIRNVSAGGCINYLDSTFCLNPQYRIHVEPSDDPDGKSTLLVALMQKQQKSIRNITHENLSIGFSIFELSDPRLGRLETKTIRYHRGLNINTSFVNYREVCHRYRLSPGHYCVIPCTFQPGQEREFLLRIYSERRHTTRRVDEPTSANADVIRNSTNTTVDISAKMKILRELVSQRSMDSMILEGGQTEAVDILVQSLWRHHDDIDQKKNMVAAFGHLSDYGLEMDCNTLKDILVKAYGSEFKLDSFNIDVCKSMVAMMDDDRSGKLAYREAMHLWALLRKWTDIFRQTDIDKHGYLRSYQLRDVLRAVGYTVSNQTFQSLIQRYGDTDGKLCLPDYLHCVVRLSTMFDIFRKSAKSGRIELELDAFVQITMYS